MTADFPFGRARACSDSCLFDATTPKAPDDEAQKLCIEAMHSISRHTWKSRVEAV